MDHLNRATDLEVAAAVRDLDAGGVGAGLGGGDAAALGHRLLGVEVHRVDDLPLLDAAPHVSAAAAADVHLRAIRAGYGADPGPRIGEGERAREVNAVLGRGKGASVRTGRSGVGSRNRGGPRHRDG